MPEQTFILFYCKIYFIVEVCICKNLFSLHGMSALRAMCSANVFFLFIF